MLEDIFYYIKNIPALLKDKEKRRVVENFFALSLLQGINYLLSMITVPYLLRVIGVERYGIISLAQSITIYIGLIVDYGFSVSAVRDVSVAREDSSKVNKIFSSVITIKCILTLLTFPLLLATIFAIPALKKDAIVYIGAFLIVIGYTLFPTWLFLGLEKMKISTVISITGKALSTAAVFVIVKTPNDYIYPSLLASAGWVFSGLISLFVLAFKFSIRYKFPTLEDIRHHLKRGFHLFISTLTSSIYRSSNPIIIKLVTGNDATVGIYATADKILTIVQTMINLLTHAVFPYASIKFSKMKFNEVVRKLKKLLYLPFITTMPILVSLLIFTPPITKIVLGYLSSELILVVRVLIPVILIEALNYFLGIIGFSNLGEEKIFTKSILYASASHIIVSCILSYFFGAKGAAVSLVMSETTMVTILLFSLKNLKRKRFLK